LHAVFVAAQDAAMPQEWNMKALISRFAKDESGATAIEYGLIAALIAVVCISVWGTIGTRLNARFNRVASALQ
jgi:pilus assembly protein Flp/PilA